MDNLILFPLGWEKCYIDVKLVVGSDMGLINFLARTVQQESLSSLLFGG